MEADKIKAKQEEELRIVHFMIALYCRHHHGGKELCPECQQIADYAEKRTLYCPHMATKTYCSACKTHCYEPSMRERIREIMRYSGPRMLLHRPLAALRHLYYTKIKKA